MSAYSPSSRPTVPSTPDGISLDFDLLVRLDLIFAKARLSYALDAVEPEISKREIKAAQGAPSPALE